MPNQYQYPGRFEYPDPGWPKELNDRQKQRLAMDVRKGQPELEEPGIAEAEKLAGAGLAARGGQTPYETLNFARNRPNELEILTKRKKQILYDRRLSGIQDQPHGGEWHAINSRLRELNE